MVFDNADPLSDPGDYAHATSMWQSSTSPSQRYVIQLPAYETIGFKFFGEGDEDDVGEARIWGVSELWIEDDPPSHEYLAEYLCKLELTLGAAFAGGTNLPQGQDGGLWVKTITVLEDRAHLPGIRVVGQEGDAVPQLVMDGLGYLGYIIEMTTDGPTANDPNALAALYRAI